LKAAGEDIDEFDLGDDFQSLAFKKKIQRKNQIKERRNLLDMKVQFSNLKKSQDSLTDVLKKVSKLRGLTQ
jgi:hypothetical protein